MPERKLLNENFRTHIGVVQLANSVVDLIVKFFPNTIDRLEPEVSINSGPTPVFLDCDESEEDVVVKLFQDGEMSDCEFGAEQVILVRDNETKTRLAGICGSRALVLTALEAKGLEFSDCLIYNFFATSPVANDWRVIYNAIEDCRLPRPDFDAKRHGALCVELKLLYVLLTRAKQNLIIYDDIVPNNYSQPMLMYWLTQKVVNKQSMSSDIQALFMKSSFSAEWRSRGEDFFERRQFGNAKLCFKRSGDEVLESICSGREFEQIGDKFFVTDFKRAKDFFQRAISIYLNLDGQVIHVAKCYEKIREFEKAGNTYVSLRRFEDAGRCYEGGQFYQSAANAYLEAGSFEHAVKCAYKCNDYHLALKIIDFCQSKHQDSIATAERIDCIKRGALYYHHKSSQADMLHFVKLFATDEEKMRFFAKYDYSNLQLEFLIESGSFEEAAKICENKFDFKLASTYFLHAGRVNDFIRLETKVIRLKYLNEYYLLELPLSEEDVSSMKVISEKYSTSEYSDIDTREIDVLMSLSSNNPMSFSD
jgi:hypothetical protein